MMQISEKLRTYIANNILFTKNGYPYSDDTSFLENGIVDSTSILELVMFIEDEFGISTEDNEIIPDNFDSIRELECFIKIKLDSKIGIKH